MVNREESTDRDGRTLRELPDLIGMLLESGERHGIFPLSFCEVRTFHYLREAYVVESRRYERFVAYPLE